MQKKRHMQAFSSLRGMADIYFHGVSGRTIAKFRKFDFNVVRQLVPDVIILELQRSGGALAADSGFRTGKLSSGTVRD